MYLYHPDHVSLRNYIVHLIMAGVDLVPRRPRPAFVACSTKSGGKLQKLDVEAWERARYQAGLASKLYLARQSLLVTMTIIAYLAMEVYWPLAYELAVRLPL